MINEIPGMAWTTDFHFTLWWHYFFGVILIAIVTYHITYHMIRKEYDALPKKGDIKHSWEVIIAMIKGKEEPPSEKYLPEQRLGYAFIGFWVIIMLVTGVIKTAKNIYGINIGENVLFLTAQLHNLGFFMLIFGVVGHLSAFLFKPNRRLLPGMIWGKICSCYTKYRHQKWENGIKQADHALEKHGGNEACKDYKH
jgi:cytochrome b subunit of formate dehydrogenase